MCVTAQWEALPPGQGFFLGELVYFVAQTGPLLTGERLYVDSCYATGSKDPKSIPRVDIITNYGCVHEHAVTQLFAVTGLSLHVLTDVLCFDFRLQLPDRQQQGGQQLPVPDERWQCVNILCGFIFLPSCLTSKIKTSPTTT